MDRNNGALERCREQGLRIVYWTIKSKANLLMAEAERPAHF